ncbi:MAG: RNA 2',3'-cyclic phosphodiesterase [Dehalococcoidales bacterium]|jgi:2'-5' RNA ligase
MSLIRAFIAVELPGELKQELAALETQLKKNSPPVVKWVDPESIHITLKFLGETSDAVIDELLLAMEESVAGVSPFKLEVGKLGAFPAVDRPQVIWVGVSGDMEKLAQLQKNLEQNTEQLRFKRESRPFSPHLTLGRVREGARVKEIQRIGKLLNETPFTAKHNIEAHEINLLKSQLTQAGAIHTIIGMVKLQ